MNREGLGLAWSLRAHHDPSADGSRQGIDEEDQENDEDDQNESNDDVLLVILPDEVVQALEGTHKPGEGGVWAAEGKREGISQHSGSQALTREVCLLLSGDPQEKPED